MSRLTTLVSRSQYGEDLILWSALSNIREGFYIDVGAMDPVHESVTALFYARGWNGINLEPSKEWFPKLVEQRPRDINLQIAASDHNGEINFHEIKGTGLSTTVGNVAIDHLRSMGKANGLRRVTCKRLADICAEHVGERSIHFLKIDVEGAEKSVLEGCDFACYRPWILAIESTIPCTYIPCHQEWEQIVLDAGYEFALAHEINRYYVAKEHAELKSRIKAP